jgi:hypothetical protein
MIARDERRRNGAGRGVRYGRMASGEVRFGFGRPNLARGTDTPDA